MFRYLCLILSLCTAIFYIGCGTENPLCTDNYCVEGDIFLREDLDGRDFEELPANVDEATLIKLLTYKESPNTDIFPISVRGVASWKIGDDTWTKWIDGDTVIYRIVLEFTIPGSDFFDPTKGILVEMNSPQYGDKNGIEYVDFLGGGIIGGKSTVVTLTEWMGPAHFKGNIVGAPKVP